MNTKAIILLNTLTVSLSLLCITPEMNMSHTSLFMGTVQFPQPLEQVPNIRIYWSGHKITCDAHNDNKKLTFAIPEEKYKRFFNLLITESQNITFESEENVVKYLKVNPAESYKFYTMRLTKDRVSNPFVKGAQRSNIGSKQSGDEAKPAWKITSKKVSPTGRIPDDTIIVCYNSNLVELENGGSNLKFPTITVKSNVLDLVGSERKLHELSAEQLLASLDLDTIHAPLQLESRTDKQNKTILALTI